MQHVENESFYTLSRFTNLKVGQTYTAGKEPNPFFKEFEKFAFPEPVLVCDAANIINEFALYTRERIFEDVRLEKFPDLPSRMTCLFIMSEENLAAKMLYWNKELGTATTLYKISCTGKIHAVDGSISTHHGGHLGLLRQEAFAYWNGYDQCSEHQELLFSGSFTVLEELRSLTM